MPSKPAHVDGTTQAQNDEQHVSSGAPRRLLASKLVAPAPLAGRLLREGLLESMMQLDGKRLILIRAAAGFGKTTLMQQYHEHCQATGRTTVWLNLDTADNDLPRFLAHLDMGIRSLESDSAANDDVPPLDPSDQGLDLLERINAIEAPFAIFLDELEAIQNPSLLSFIQQILEYLPPNGVLLITSRVTPDIGLGRLRARGQLLEINPGALRFSLEEAASFIRDKHQLQLSDTDIATLHRCTEGWITAIYLASLSLQGRSSHSSFVASFSGSNLELAEYLAEDILARQSDGCRQFLIDTSILGQLSAPLCAAVTGCADSAEMLQYLERNNLFLFPVDNEHQWFRYHSLFASFLRDALERYYPGRACQLHRRAADWFLAQNRPIPAIEHLLQAGALDEAAACIDQHIDELTDAGRSRLLLRWPDRLPVAILERFPRLCMAYAWTLALHRRYDDALGWVQRLSCMQDNGGHSLFTVEAETIRCLVLVLTDRLEECYEAASLHLDRLPPDEMFQFGVVANALAFSMVSTGRYDEARRLLSRAALRDTQRASTFMRAIAASIEGIIDLVQGRLGTGLMRMQINLERSWEGGAGKVFGGKPSQDIVTSAMLYEADELEEVSQRLSAALPYIKDSSPPDSLIAAHILQARIAYLNGENSAFQRYLADLEEIGHDSGSSRVVCSAWLERARVALLENRLDSASYLLSTAELEGAWESEDTLFYSNDGDTPSLLRLRLRIAQGDFAGVADTLREGMAISHECQRYRRLLKQRLLLALALDGQGHSDEAFDELTEALRFASHEGFLRIFLDEGAALGLLLQRWAIAFQASSSSLGIEPRFLARLLQRIGGSSESTTQTKGGMPQEALTSRELQVVRLLAAGHRNKVIAEKMFLSEFTVKTHLRNINAKLGAQGRTEAVAIARARGLLD